MMKAPRVHVRGAKLTAIKREKTAILLRVSRAGIPIGLNVVGEVNIYGCPPCPRCGSKFATPHYGRRLPRGRSIEFWCDACGFRCGARPPEDWP